MNPTPTVKPVHLLSARAALYHACPPGQLLDWPQFSMEMVVRVAAAALAEGSTICFRWVGGVLTYSSWRREAWDE